MFRKFIKFLIAILVLLIVCYFGLKHLFPLEHSLYVEKYSAEYSVDKYLSYAVIKAESNFSSNAVSRKGANGLMQITDDTAKWISEKTGDRDFSADSMSDPETNIKYGIWYLSYLINEMESEDLAVISYNAGLNHVKEWLSDSIISKTNVNIENVPYKETKIYLTKVKAYRKIYQLLYR